MIHDPRPGPNYGGFFAFGLFIGAGIIMLAILASMTIKLIEDYEYETGNSLFSRPAFSGELRTDPHP